MGDNDHQENQSNSASDENIADIELTQDQVEQIAGKEKTDSRAGTAGHPPDDPLAWIDGSEAGMGATEMPTLQYPGERARIKIEEPDTPVANQRPAYSQGVDDAQPLDNLADAMAWLDKLAASKGEPVEELPTQIIPKDMPPDLLNITGAGVIYPSDGMDVLDDPISWLEQLAADQDTPLEELPSVADRLLASEIISKIDDSQGTAVSKVDPPEVAVPLEDALLYLEQVAEDEGVLLQVVTLDPITIPTDLDALLMQVDLLAAGKIASLPVVVMATAVGAADVAKEPRVTTAPQIDWNNLSESMPEDPDEALAWMESLAADGDGLAETTSAGLVLTDADFAELDTLPPTNIAVEKGDEILAEMPEDPDEAMAWLERVSAESAASVESEIKIEVPEEHAAPAVAAASQALADGDIDKALVSYKTLIAQGENLDAVVAGLETAVAENPGLGRLRYLLGDAYMKNGQHQKALEAYQQGSLDNL